MLTYVIDGPLSLTHHEKAFIRAEKRTFTKMTSQVKLSRVAGENRCTLKCMYVWGGYRRKRRMKFRDKGGGKERGVSIHFMFWCKGQTKETAFKRDMYSARDEQKSGLERWRHPTLF